MDQHDRGDGFRLPHLLILLLLGIAPGFALHGITQTGLVNILAIYGALISAVTYIVYASDKRRARTNGRRTPESVLHLLELLGGWPGAFVAQHRLRHKNAKLSYQIVFWMIVALHESVAVDYQRGWPLLRQLTQ